MLFSDYAVLVKVLAFTSTKFPQNIQCEKAKNSMSVSSLIVKEKKILSFYLSEYQVWYSKYDI